jgi:hypothetical protein
MLNASDPPQYNNFIYLLVLDLLELEINENHENKKRKKNIIACLNKSINEK